MIEFPRQKRDTPKGFPWLPKGDYDRVEVVRDRGGLGDFVQILGACEQLQKETGAKVTLLGPDGLVDLGLHSPVEVRRSNIKNSEKRGIIREKIPGGMRVYLDYPCPTSGYETDEVKVDRLTIWHRALGVSVGDYGLILTNEEKADAEEWCRENTGASDPIVIVYQASRKWKDYYHAEALFEEMSVLGHPVVMLDNRSNLQVPSTYGLSLRQHCAVVNQARLVVTPDTGWLHVAGFLRRPIFGLFGAQDPNYRQAIYQSSAGWHVGHCPFSNQHCWDSPCGNKDTYMPCMRSDPIMIADQIETILFAPEEDQEPEAEWYFFHIPKTGGRSIEQGLKKTTGIVYPETNPHTFQPDLCGESKIFSVIRNPIDRAVSAFIWIKNMPGDHAWLTYIRTVDPNTFLKTKKYYGLSRPKPVIQCFYRKLRSCEHSRDSPTFP